MDTNKQVYHLKPKFMYSNARINCVDPHQTDPAEENCVGTD